MNRTSTRRLEDRVGGKGDLSESLSEPTYLGLTSVMVPWPVVSSSCDT